MTEAPTIAILAIVGASVYTALTLGYKTYNINMDSTSDQQNLRSATLHISKQVRNATGSNVSVSSGSLTVNGKTYTIDNTAKTLKYNGAILAYNIGSFTPAISGNLLTVTLTSVGGITVSTQLALR